MELGFTEEVTACTLDLWLSLTSVVEAVVHGLMMTREVEQVGTAAASLCLGFSTSKVV